VIDRFIVERAPWKFAKDPDPSSQEARRRNALHGSRSTANYLRLGYPVMPEATAKIWTQLGMRSESNRFESRICIGENCGPAKLVGKVEEYFLAWMPRRSARWRSWKYWKSSAAAIFAPASAQTATAPQEVSPKSYLFGSRVL